MASGGNAPEPKWRPLLLEWRQGDYSLDVPQMVAIDEVDGGDFVPVAYTVVGVCAVSQTCDIVNWGSGKHWVVVAPLVEVDGAVVADAASGRTPAYAPLECPPADNVLVDLNRMMTLHKSVLAGMSRNSGFKTEANRIRFAEALQRKHGRFAFPDEFSFQILGRLRKRIAEAHRKDSDVGKVYRSIARVRAAASPAWDAPRVEVGFRFVLELEDRREANRQVIAETIAKHFEALSWPEGFVPADPPFVLQTVEEMSAREWTDSQEIDWQFISWAKD